MYKSVLFASAILLLLSTLAEGQELKFNAILGADGKIQLVPAGNTVPQTSQTPPNASHTAQIRPSDLYLWKDKSGAVKGVFDRKAQVVEQAWAPGDTVQKYPTTDQFSANGWLSTPSPLSSDTVAQIAEETSRKLLQAVVGTICGLNPRPDSVSPTVQVSFSFLAGGSLSIQATWQTAKVCAAKK